MADITINGITVDPLAAAPQSLGVAGFAAAGAALPVANTNYVLVQVDRPLTATLRGQLEQLGAFTLEHVPENTYVCRYSPTDLSPVRQLPFVRWAGPYLR